MIRIVFSDYDGTVQLREPGNPPREYITEDSRREIERFISEGGIFIVTSGRFSQSVHADMKKQHLSGTMIGANGSVIIRKNGEREVFCMDPDVPEKLVRDILAINSKVTLIHFTNDEIISRLFQSDSEVPLDSQTPEEFLAGVSAGRAFTNKIAVRTDTREEIMEIRRMLEEKYREKINIAEPSDCQIDLTAYGVNKGYAIRKLLDEYGLTRKQAAGMGDALNDMAIMENVDLRFAMKNGNSELQKLCDYTVETVGKAFEIIREINRTEKQ